MSASKLLLPMVAAMLTLPVFADVTDDAIKLAQSGVTEDVIVAWCEHQNVSALSAQDVLRLKDGKVPDRAIAAMIRSANNGERTERESVPASANTTEPAATTPSTTYVYSTPYYYSDGTPYYYGDPYYGGYYGGYGWGPSVGFGFRFGGGHGGFGGRGGFHGGHHR